ncbi:MAG TPA: aminotransferase class I/II-fold pyridoxal phosphate-dependent enzyme, partial [Polyangiaceae bacterium]|nr:aminotransferase class I/II-fold pyridoxal phosphate-dependent enzyme [Polyangiaceae bacterium]
TGTSAIRPGQAERARLAASTWAVAQARGLARQVAEDDRFDGRSITLQGRRIVNFGSCSYLGLETDARLKTAACEAVLRYGVQFSTSRAYIAAPLYREFEELLSEMIGGEPVVLAPTATLAHSSALPVLVGERDAVLYDIQVHASVQGALPELKLRGVPCEAVRHNDLARLEERVRALSARHERVYYLCDGIYSMHGDTVDVPGLYELLDREPALFAYIDDAHGVSWSGRRGAGTVLGRRRLHPRMAVVYGLSKSFAAAGGAIVVPDQTLANRLLTEGRTLIFSGPLQPAQLGAGVASARIHLSAELDLLQGQLNARIEAFDRAAARDRVPLTSTARSPIRFIPVGDEGLAMDLATALLQRGYYVNVACYPAVPRKRAGVRLMLTGHHTYEDIQGLVAEIAERLHPAKSQPVAAAPSPNWTAPIASSS